MVMSNAREGDSRTRLQVTVTQVRNLTIGEYVNERVAGRIGVTQDKVTDDLVLSENDAHTIAFDLENIAGFAEGEVEDQLPGDPHITVGDVVRIGIAIYERRRTAAPQWPYPLPG